MIHRSAQNLTCAVLLALAIAGSLSVAALAEPVLSVSDAWTRTGSAGASTAVYFTVENNGTSDDTLKSIETPVAAKAQIHTSVQAEGGGTLTRRLNSVRIFPGEKVPFEPAGLHIALMGLKEPLEPGDTVPVTLIFEHAGPVKVQAEVRNGSPPAPATH
jgi:copper(I)-binding protein